MEIGQAKKIAISAPLEDFMKIFTHQKDQWLRTTLKYVFNEPMKTNNVLKFSFK